MASMSYLYTSDELSVRAASWGCLKMPILQKLFSRTPIINHQAKWQTAKRTGPRMG